MHLNLSDRIKIESMLNERTSFKNIGLTLHKHPDTIRNEVSLHKIMSPHTVMAKPSKPLCSKYNSCKSSHSGCFNKCPLYIETKCPKLLYSCSVCNGCPSRGNKCRLNKFFYNASLAYKDYKTLLTDSRKGLNMSSEQLLELNSIVSPFIKKGFSPEQILMIKPELNISIKSIYNYINSGYLNVGNLDLLRKVSYKKRKTKKKNVIFSYKINRTYDDFLLFTAQNNITDIVEMDTVEAIKDDEEPCLLTFLFRKSNLQIAFILPNQKSETVVSSINSLYKKIGHDQFFQYFKVILTDNGKEMKLPNQIEFNEYGEIRCNIFYCDPYTSCQKAKCEKNHDFIRRYIPKKSSMKKFSQDDINLMMSHINSIPRKDRNSASIYTPYDRMLELSSPDLLNHFSLKKIISENLIINKKIFK